MKPVPQFFIILMLLIQNYAQEYENLQLTERKEDLHPVNSTNKVELKPLLNILTENSIKVGAVEIVQEVKTEISLQFEQPQETPTELNVLQNQTISKEELNSKEVNINTNEDQSIHQSENNTTSHYTTESLEDDISTTTIANNLPTKPLITLEEYALKQMRFILDSILIETQEFVAKVLQASVNTVFQRDNLKRYAEGLNHLLYPDNDAEYSGEIIVQTKNLTQDELYEEILHKLNFLKNKPSKYLQSQLPHDWVNEYRNKRADLAVWLDKASEQMHQQFNRYVSEEEDHIKYQYFNEAFDDISRATEIHHKLALLADLVKIVKNKKQITFADLYMQT